MEREGAGRGPAPRRGIDLGGRDGVVWFFRSLAEDRKADEEKAMADEPFGLIEKKINDLAGMVAALKKEKAALAAQFDQKSSEAKELARKVAELTQERNEIRERVDKILSRLETIEL